jgi:serine/threonine protein kinase
MSRGQPQYQPGEVVPGTVYRVHRVIGAGGMGTVYDVEDTSVGKRYVLKTLHANLADREDLAGRLLREARALARMHHPSIVEVFTAGTTSDQLRLPYFVMERLNGQSLRQVLNRRARIELDQAVDIGVDLLDALDHAHELGMIHRDVKPDNIFLHKGIDGMPVAKLLDFGIAKVLASSTQLTGGRFIGTFRYASPEQILGKEVTPQSDLYAAALTLFEMIAGRGPFDDFVGEIEIGKAHASVAAPRLSKFLPNVPRVLDDLIASALDKRPEARPKDAFTFASVLRDIKRAARGEAPPSEQVTARPVVTSAPTAVAPSIPTQSATASQAAITPPMGGPTSDRDTRLESPQAHNADTAAAPPSSMPSSQTNPYGPQVLDTRVAPQHTIRLGHAHTMQDGAPAPMTMVPTLSPQPPHVIDRAAETRASEPVASHVVPRGDTQPLAIVQPRVPRPSPDPLAPTQLPSVPPPADGGVSTFAAQTTDASAVRKGSTQAIVLGVIAFVVVIAIGIGAFVLFKRDPQTARPTQTPTPTLTLTPTPTPTLTPTPFSSVRVPVPVPAPESTQTPTPTLTLAPTATLAPTTGATARATASASPTTRTIAPAGSAKRDPLHVGSGLE